MLTDREKHELHLLEHHLIHAYPGLARRLSFHRRPKLAILATILLIPAVLTLLIASALGQMLITAAAMVVVGTCLFSLPTVVPLTAEIQERDARHQHRSDRNDMRRDHP
jgi:hypothetical protein